MREKTIKIDNKDFTLIYKSDIEIFEDFLKQQIDAKTLKHYVGKNLKKGNRTVWLLTKDEKKYILKWIYKKISIRKKVLYFLFGSYYPTLFERVTKAINNGCSSTNDIYLVAEKGINPYWKLIC